MLTISLNARLGSASFLTTLWTAAVASNERFGLNARLGSASFLT